MRRFLSVLAATAVLAVGATGSSAMPLGVSEDVEAGAHSLVQGVHGCHRDVQHGAAGWHYHAGRYCDRIAVSPPRQHYRAPVCRLECSYVGPIKICKDRCW